MLTDLAEDRERETVNRLVRNFWKKKKYIFFASFKNKNYDFNLNFNNCVKSLCRNSLSEYRSSK